MKIKQFECVKAYNVLSNLSNELRIPSDIALSLFQVKKICKDQFEFESEEQLKILKTYEAKQSKEGSWTIEDVDKRTECLKKLQELDDLEIDIDYEIKSIKLDGSFNLSINDIEALSPFIEFN